MSFRFQFRTKTVTSRQLLLVWGLLFSLASGLLHPVLAGKISNQFKEIEAMYSDALGKENPRQIKESKKIYEESLELLEGILESKRLTVDEKFYAEYLMAFVYYHISLSEADSLFTRLSEIATIVAKDSLLAKAVRERIIGSFGVIFLDMNGKIEKQKTPTLDQLVSTYLNRGIIYEKVNAIIPLIALTRDMYLIVEDGRGDQEKYNAALNEIQKRQQRITEHLGPESRK